MIQAMVLPCQAPTSLVLVAGRAGSGKTTLGRELARRLRRPLLDLDILTNPLLDRLNTVIGGPHWNSAGAHTSLIREGRYEVLRSAAEDLVRIGQYPILVAPFTRELTGGPEWGEVSALVPAITVVYLDGSPELLARRRSERDAARDADRPPDHPTTTPVVPHLRIDASLSTEQQVFRVLRHIGAVAPIDPRNPLFDVEFDAILFDLDGTLVDSTAAVHRSWDRLAREYCFDRGSIRHGMPAAASLAGILEPARIRAALVRMTELETTDVSDVVATPGAMALLDSLPDNAKAIVTSGSPPIAGARIAAAGLTAPAVIVTSADIENGKPNPEPFVLGARRLGVDPRRCLVIEDAPAGITAARAAGCHVVAVGGTSAPEELNADLYVDSLESLHIKPTSGGYRLTL